MYSFIQMGAILIFSLLRCSSKYGSLGLGESLGKAVVGHPGLGGVGMDPKKRSSLLAFCHCVSYLENI